MVYDYFCNKLKLSNVKVIKVSGNDDIKKSEKVSKYKDKAIFIITNKIEELLEYCYMDDAVVLFADNERYTYKKLLYICGQIRNVNLKLPEVLWYQTIYQKILRRQRIWQEISIKRYGKSV